MTADPLPAPRPSRSSLPKWFTCQPWPLRHNWRLAAALSAAWLALAWPVQAPLAQAVSGSPSSADTTVLEARDAARRRDRNRLAALQAALSAANHPLLPWVAYWDLNSRLKEASLEEVEAFYQRWAGTYVEDRLRNDWLLELGRRRDFANLARDYPRFRMNDDREVSCWWLLTEHLAGRDVREASRSAWLAQKEADDGCNMLATAMVDAKRFTVDDVWLKARLSVELQRPVAARAAAGLLGNGAAADIGEALDNPARFVRRLTAVGRSAQELRTIALMRLAATDALEAAGVLNASQAEDRLSPSLASWAWASIGRQAAFKLAPEAASYFQRAAAAQRGALGWSDETLAWGVRSALRGLPPANRWPLVLRLTGQMSATGQQDPAWQYWRALALKATARDGAEGDAQRQQAQQQLAELAGPLNFYAQLAADELKQAPAWPPTPVALSEAEREAARSHPALQRALLLMAIGLRGEGRREWNFTVRAMADREVLAAARLASDRGDWQLCINTAERSKGEVDLALRYPMPWANEIRAASQAAGVEQAFVFGLIRQESRFMPQLKSSVGATGLMQVMPATGKLVAKKLGFDCCSASQLADPAINLRLGTTYLRSALDELAGSQAMAAAAYNAGPGRPRRWREGATLDAAAWAEHVPFEETRDYVKRVLSNAAVYSALMAGQAPTLRARLGQTIGPREPGAPAPAAELQ